MNSKQIPVADLTFSYDEIKYFNKTKLDLKFNGVIEFIGDDLVLEINRKPN